MPKVRFQIHLWSGLIPSWRFFLLGLAGAILVFDQDILGAMRAPNALAGAALPSNPNLRVLSFAAQAKAGYDPQARLGETPGGDERGGPPPTVVSLDPVTGAAPRTEKQQNNMLPPVHFFHEDFMLGALGRQIIGWSSVMMLITAWASSYKIFVFLSGLLPQTFVVIAMLMRLQERKNKAAAADTRGPFAEATLGA